MTLPTVDEIAQQIRTADGAHRMGAGALAEMLHEWLSQRMAAPAQPGQGAEVPDVSDLLVIAVECGLIRMSQVMNTDLQDALYEFAKRLAASPSAPAQESPAAAAVDERDRLDAERYRWLRDEADYLRVPEGSPQVCLTDEWGEIVSVQATAYPRGETLDAAIDAARAAKGE